MDSQTPNATPEEQRAILMPSDDWTDATAKHRSLADFSHAETYRQQNHDTKYKNSMRLYYGFRNKKFWEGTRVPRAAIPVLLAFEQIEAMMAQVIGAIFADDPPFDAEPNPGTTWQQAQWIVYLLRGQMKDLGCEYSGIKLYYKTLREIIRRSYKNALIFGIGPIEFGWIMKEVQKLVWERQAVPRRGMVQHPVTGEQVPVPLGGYHFVAQQRMDVHQISKPFAEVISPLNWYGDPHQPSPIIQEGRYGFKRTLKTIAEIKQIGQQEGFNLPSDKDLIELGHSMKITEGDNDLSVAEAYRGQSYQPSRNYTESPELMRLEVIEGKRCDRVVWMLNREWVFYNQPNDYGCINVLNSFYVDVPDRPHGISLCDLVEGDQELASNLLEARMDELSVMVHTPLLKKRGISLSSARMRPFAIWEVDDTDKDMKWMDRKPVAQEAFIEYDALERRTQKVTGNSDLAVLGAPSAGGNSANRTAAGITTQAQATSTRKQYQVENLEDQFMVPLCNAFWAMNKKFLDPEAALTIVGKDGANTIDPVQILNGELTFQMKASQKLRAKQAAPAIAWLAQTFLNPAFDQQLNMTGQTIDINAITGLIADANGLPVTNLVRPMTPQEQQMMQQQKMAEANLKQQMQQQRLDAQGQHIEAKGETDILLELVRRLLTADAAHEVLDLQSPAEIKARAQQEFPVPKQLGQGNRK